MLTLKTEKRKINLFLEYFLNQSVSFTIEKFKDMQRIKWLLIIVIIPLLGFTSFHKYYVSNTQIEYVKDKKSVQITSGIFIDDFEKLLKERYDETIVLNAKKEEALINTYIEKYLLAKLEIIIDTKSQDLVFIGKEYEDDIVYCYLEIQNIEVINTMEISNTLLFDLFEAQKNIVRTHINEKHKTFILIPENDKGVLNF